MDQLPGRLASFVKCHHLPGRLFGVAVAALTFAVVAEQADAKAGAVEEMLKSRLIAATPIAKVAEEVLFTNVYDGADLNGDGVADFVNPTGRDVRELDDFGYGHFGASRDGGSRKHAGVDYMGLAGQDVVAPISGRVIRHGYAYGTDPSLKLIEIVNDELGVRAKVLYINPTANPGDTVEAGEKIGTLSTLQHRYAGITDHVHLELIQAGEHLDTEEVIVARRVRRTLTGEIIDERAAGPGANRAG